MRLRPRDSALLVGLALAAGAACSGQAVLSDPCVSTGATGNGSACASGGGPVGTGGATAAGGQGGQGAIDSELNAQNLEGYWLTDGAIGNCIDFVAYMRFLPDSVAESIRIDNDACYLDRRGTFVTQGTYSLVGRTLSIELEDGRRTRFDVALHASQDSTVLRTVVYSLVDDRNWRGTFLDETRDSAGNLTYSNEVRVSLEFDEVIPPSGAGACRVTTHFRVVQRRPDENIDEDYSGSFDPVACQYAVSGVDGYQTIALGAQPDGDHPNWVKANVQPKLWGGLRLDPAHLDYLTTSGGWSKYPGIPPGL